MARKQQSTQAPKQQTQKPKEAKAEQQKASPATQKALYLIIATAVIVVLLALFLLTQPASLPSTVPFSTFKSNLNAAPRISVLVVYAGTPQFDVEEPCVNYIIEIISNKRSPSTIDLYETNATTCTYANGLGNQNLQPQTTTAAACVSQATSEPGITLNYSATNSSTITAQQMQIYGNSAYFAQCPIAVDLN